MAFSPYPLGPRLTIGSVELTDPIASLRPVDRFSQLAIKL
jgi:hypothetical protein